MKKWSLAAATLLVGITTGVYFSGSTIHGQATKPATTNLSRDFGSYREIVKEVLPAVVSVEAKGKAVKAATGKRTQGAPLDDPRIPEEFRKFFVMPDDAILPPRNAFGSGFFIDSTGVLLTNNHVVEGAESVTVHLQDGRSFTTKNIRTDPRTDLAVVTLDAKAGVTFPYLELGDSSAMEVGDRVLAIGAPFRLAGTVTSGIVSAKGRNGMRMNMYEDFIQTDAAINPGNSGGPLISLDGKVIGINSVIKSETGGFQGIGLAVASNLAKSVAQSLRHDGVVRRGYLGVQIRDIDNSEVARKLGLKKDKGILVGDVLEKSPAAKAGLKAGDVITAIAGSEVTDSLALQNLVAGLPIGKAAEFTVLRDGKTQAISVTIEEQPREFGMNEDAPVRPSTKANPESVALDKIGVDVSELTPETASELGFRKGTTGVIISKVESGSDAYAAGLRRGMLISKIDKLGVSSVNEVRQALTPTALTHGVLLQVVSPSGGTNYILLRDEAAT